MLYLRWPVLRWPLRILTTLRAAEDTSFVANDSTDCHWSCVLVTFLSTVTKYMTKAIYRRKDLFWHMV